MSEIVKEIPDHDFDCDYIHSEIFSIGCVACTYKFVKSSLDALIAEYRDRSHDLDEIERKEFEDKIDFYKKLEAQIP